MADSSAKVVLVRTILATLTTSELVRIKVCTDDNAGSAILRIRNMRDNVLATPTILPDPSYDTHTWANKLQEALKHLTTDAFGYHFIVTDYDRTQNELFGWKAAEVTGESDDYYYCHI